MTVIYIICKLLTFPGTYLRGFFEHLYARRSKCVIESDTYIRFDEASGHVEHSLPEKKSGAAVIALVPGLICFVIGIVLAACGLLPLAVLGIGPSVPVMFAVYLLMAYVGVSLLCNLFPLVEDALYFKEKFYGEESTITAAKILLFIPMCICIAGAYIEKYCINILIIGGAVAAAFILL